MSYKRIWIASFPRSGSTWLANFFCQKNSRVLFEPDNPGWNWAAYQTGIKPFRQVSELDIDKYLEFFSFCYSRNYLIVKLLQRVAHRYIPPFYVYPQYSNLTKSALCKFGMLAYGVNLNILDKIAKPRFVAMKSVTSFMLTEFLYENLEVCPVLIRRNPLNVYSSWVKMGYDPEKYFSECNVEKLLSDDVLSECNIKLPENRTELLCFFIALHDKYYFNWKHKYSSWNFIDHDELTDNAYDTMEVLFKRLSIDFDANVLQNKINKTVRMPSSEELHSRYSIVRDPSREKDKWKHSLKSQEVDTFMNYYNSFGVDYSY